MQLAEFREYARNFNVVPVSRKLLADGETPLAVYRKLGANRPATFLLESAEHGGAWSRYSFIGVNCEATLTAENGLATWLGKPPAGAPTGIDPLAALRLSANHLKSPKIAGLPPLTGGLVGYLGYDTVRRLEKLPNLAIDDLQIPELAFMLTTDLAVLDHSDGTITLIANAINWDGSDERVDEAYHAAVARLDQMAKDLASPLPGYLSELSKPANSAIASNISTPEFLAKVAAIKEEILAGEAFQVVLSQRFEIECKAEPIDVYRMLRLHNPSPYMYLFHFADGVSVVGSSPEALVKVTDGEVMVHPIAGTRKRSDSPEEDARLATELLADPKERAEHLMLVDLVIAAALIFSAVIGYRNGFIRTLFKFVGFVLGGVLGIYLSLKFSQDWKLDIKRIGFVIIAIVAGGYLCSFIGGWLAKGLRATIFRGPLAFIDSIVRDMPSND